MYVYVYGFTVEFLEVAIQSQPQWNFVFDVYNFDI